MTEKELRRLRRHDLLQLLLLQSKENQSLRDEIDELTGRNRSLEDDRKRLNGWLDEKDALIKELEAQLKSGRRVKLRGDPGGPSSELSVNELLETIKTSLDQRLVPSESSGSSGSGRSGGRKKKKKKKTETDSNKDSQ